jgi:cell wall-associated NlpC family hydrolase
MAGGAITVPIAALVLGLAAISGSAPPAAAAAPQLCVTSGPIRGLSQMAATNARIVAAAAERKAGAAGAVIAVMVGYTESGLRILGNPTVYTGSLPTQGLGSNSDSLGIFQQRASWGTVAQRLDPAISAGLFIDRLTHVPNWVALAPWVAAQDVQVSAYDGRPRAANGFSSVYGGNYQANYALAREVVAQIDDSRGRQSCGALSGGLLASQAPGSHGLPATYRIPISAKPAEARVVAFAIAQLDKPYVFGAAGPSAYDCSGLTMAAWAKVGVHLPHSSQEQAVVGTPTTANALVPGDLILVPGDDGTLAAPGHVGLYIGDGLVLNAADQQDGIRVQTYPNFIDVGHGLSALRHIA